MIFKNRILLNCAEKAMNGHTCCLNYLFTQKIDDFDVLTTPKIHCRFKRHQDTNLHLQKSLLCTKWIICVF